MDIGSAIVCALIAIQQAGISFAYAPQQTSLIIWRFQRCLSAMWSAPWQRRYQIVSLVAVTAMYAVVLIWDMTGAVLPASLSVAAAIVITAGWSAIAYAAIAQLVTRFRRPTMAGVPHP